MQNTKKAIPLATEAGYHDGEEQQPEMKTFCTVFLGSYTATVEQIFS